MKKENEQLKPAWVERGQKTYEEAQSYTTKAVVRDILTTAFVGCCNFKWQSVL